MRCAWLLHIALAAMVLLAIGAAAQNETGNETQLPETGEPVVSDDPSEPVRASTGEIAVQLGGFLALAGIFLYVAWRSR